MRKIELAYLCRHSQRSRFCPALYLCTSWNLSSF